MVILPPDDPAEFLARVGPPNERGCREWTRGRFPGREGRPGYGAYSLRGHQVGAHRVAYAIAYGQVPGGVWVLHRCDWPPCCEPTHLYLGGNDENVADRIRRGRGLVGEQHPLATLTDALVIRYRTEYRDGKITVQQIRDGTGLAQTPVYFMLTGKTWKHLPVGYASRAMSGRTHCPAGHAYDEINTYTSPSGDRRCRECGRNRDEGRRRS